MAFNLAQRMGIPNKFNQKETPIQMPQTETSQMNNLSVRSESLQSGPSGIQNPKASPASSNKSSIPDEVITTGKALDEIMPVPVSSAAVKRDRNKISGEITSEEFIKNKKDAQIKKSSKPVKKNKK
ncbi:unnamed protein product [Acanthoscelides obtectus]|uniref:Uncharacterized protein n=1 Tax=Acanthoscelides obtectus TaxID=200917 RepID=A0A9P0Q112_ACAOB|nr:unnamed protein product [Acanthoscelides obtectus]CAK1643663.1 hypothetical protein AOBTE_LOCUS13626 [Acanthoscelides obtectus]